MRATFLCAVAALTTVPCWASPLRAQAADDAAAVRAANVAFDAAIQRRDVAAIVAMYARDGALLWQNMPRMSGPAIEQAWAESFGMQGFGLHIRSQTISVARAGDIALDEGSLQIELPRPQGVVTSQGKYLVVWRKVDGAWKILYDVYNTDAPPTAPAAAGSR